MRARTYLAIASVASLVLVSLHATPRAEASVRNSSIHTADGRVCTIWGTAGPDHLRAKKAGDVVCGFGGNDVLSAAGLPRVTLIGGSGSDILYAVSPPGFRSSNALGVATSSVVSALGDTLIGDDGNDTIVGGPNNDSELGGLGNDRLLGGGGNDNMSGGSGSDFLSGGVGNDLLDGGANNDVLSGGPGNDHLYGGSGNDTIYGDDGNDALVAGTGTDVLMGGSGDDLLEAGSGGTDSLSGGPGSDDFSCGITTDPIIIVSDSSDNVRSDCEGDNVDSAAMEWQGTVTAVNAQIVTVKYGDVSDSAKAWLNSHGNPSTVNFNLASAKVAIDSGGAITVGSKAEISANSPSSGVTLIAVTATFQSSQSD